MTGFFTMSDMALKRVMLVAGLGALLTACGGGGGSDSSANSSANVVTSPNTTTPVVTPVVSTPNSDIAQRVLAQLNANRQQCGFGALTYNPELEKAAANHASYLSHVSIQNKVTYGSHNEGDTAGLIATGRDNPYYTGYAVSNRIKTDANKSEKAQSVNYDAAMVAENLSLSTLTTTKTTVDANATSQNMLSGLLAAPYHMRGLVSPDLTQIGISYNQADWQNASSRDILSLLELVSASPMGQGLSTRTALLSYPCGGSTGTEYALTDESPNPMPNRDLQQNPVGQPIYLLAPNNKTIGNVTATLAVRGVSTSNLTILTAATDPNRLLKANEAFIIPETKLNPATTYTVTYTVTYTTGEQISNSFNFSTKA